jgi:hypothetical protein
LSAPARAHPLLRLTEHAAPTPERYRVEIALEHDGPRTAVTSTFDLPITPQDAEDLRKYQEAYLDPETADRVEQRMADLGEALFKGIFFATHDATRLWHRISDRLADTRVEVVTAVRHAASVPWELIRDPDTSTPIALEARAFVRAHPSPVKSARSVEAAAGPIRILVVICRPPGGNNPGFRSVARRLLRGLDDAARESVAIDVLRPPTFDALSRALRDAKQRGEPYHVVHFDGHGVYGDAVRIADVFPGASARGGGGAHGYLVFESPEEAGGERRQLVDGPSLGKLLHETRVPVLVLNACSSARADAPASPDDANADVAGTDTHGDVASFGSLALEVMDRGVSGVVAMRYKVSIFTAPRFVDDLYRALADGLALGEAVTRGRKQLHDRPLPGPFSPRKLQDWPVPVVYEAEPLALFPVPARGLAITLAKAAGGERGARVGVPAGATPDADFFGRDETLLTLDRAFDRHPVVLLHGDAGIGKSSAAAEFARWYATTGGVDGPVLWTSFERRLALSEVLDPLARCFERDLEQAGVQWVALAEEDRRDLALQVLKQREVLWIWDGVDAVAGEEQRALLDFLREARGTKARFLLTSRRDEHAWLGELPARIAVPPMPWQELVELARALADKRGVRLDRVADWRPLLLFTKGSPREITVHVGQALRDGVRTKEQVAAFVKKLGAGEGALEKGTR